MTEISTREYRSIGTETGFVWLPERWATDFKILLQRRDVTLPRDRELVSQIHAIKRRVLPSGKVSFTAQAEPRDVAILTLSDTAEPSVPANQQRLVIGTTRPATSSTFSIWGWGISQLGGSPSGDLLSGDLGANATVSSIGTDGSYNWLNAMVNNDARTCEGDSEGPSSSYSGGRYIATGVHATVRKPDGSNRSGCAEIGDTMRWSTTYDKLSWIEATLRTTYGATFSCIRLGSGASAYMQCY